jgi:hypothetical protein
MRRREGERGRERARELMSNTDTTRLSRISTLESEVNEWRKREADFAQMQQSYDELLVCMAMH